MGRLAVGHARRARERQPADPRRHRTVRPDSPVVPIALHRATGGNGLAGTNEGVIAHDAPFLGATGGLTDRVVGLAPSPTDEGHWLATGNGAPPPLGDDTGAMADLTDLVAI
jgi:hypothetical protein